LVTVPTASQFQYTLRAAASSTWTVSVELRAGVARSVAAKNFGGSAWRPRRTRGRRSVDVKQGVCLSNKGVTRKSSRISSGGQWPGHWWVGMGPAAGLGARKRCQERSLGALNAALESRSFTRQQVYKNSKGGAELVELVLRTWPRRMPHTPAGEGNSLIKNMGGVTVVSCEGKNLKTRVKRRRLQTTGWERGTAFLISLVRVRFFA
jgi:hypothetical protein